MDNLRNNLPQYQYGNKFIKKHIGTKRPSPPDFFVGRAKVLETMYQSLHQKNQNILLLVNGEGGIGKTTLAAKYYYTYQNHYKHLAWVFTGENLLDALLTLAGPLHLVFPNTNTAEDNLHLLLQELMMLHEPCLLVIDNANNAEELDLYHNALLHCPNFHIVLTSRTRPKLNQTKTIEIKHLSKYDALKIFQEHYPYHEEDVKYFFYDIFVSTGRNTLVIELLAKNLRFFNTKRNIQYSLRELWQDINKNLLVLRKSEKVTTLYQTQGGIKRKEKPEDIILAMYQLNDLSDKEQRILSLLSILPAESIDMTYIEDFLSIPSNPFEDVAIVTRSLHEKGWIEYRELVNSIKISPVIQDIIKTKQQDRLQQDTDALLRHFIEKFKYEGTHITGVKDYEELIVLNWYAENVIDNYPFVNNTISIVAERLGSYHQITGSLPKALDFFKIYSKISQQLVDKFPTDENHKKSLAISYSKLGETHSALGNLNKALEFFEIRSQLGKELYDSYPNNVSFKNGLAISYSKLGSTHSALGNLNKALEFFEKDIELTKELYDSYPNNVNLKNGLAISYSKLGETHSALGNLNKALEFFEIRSQLGKELYDSYPNNVSFKNGLAISYEKLGSTHSALGNLNKALEFFEIRSQLGKELYDSYPNNVSFKNGLAIAYCYIGNTYSALGDLKIASKNYKLYTQLQEELYKDFPLNVKVKNDLAISYEKLGSTHSALGNLNKALEFFEIETTLFEELYDSYPNNVNLKNGLAISYSKLGETHSALGNLNKALEFFEIRSQLGKELYDSYPNNVSFKNGLAVSYYKLAQVYETTNVNAAIDYFKKAAVLWEALVVLAPQYVMFKKYLGIVQGVIKRLEM